MIEISIAVLMAVSSAVPATDAEVKVAQRLAAAIRNSAAFNESDFVRPPGPVSQAALRRLSSCKVDSVDHWLKPDPTEQDAYIQNPDKVAVTYLCDGVPATTPVVITLRLQNGKIAMIETHNADLLKSK